jgi:hypothetical protein
MKKLVLSILMGMCLLSCSSDRSDDGSVSTSVTLPIKMETMDEDGEKIYHDLYYNGDKLIESNGRYEESNDKLKSTIVYKGDKIVSIKEEDGEITEYEYREDGKLLYSKKTNIDPVTGYGTETYRSYSYARSGEVIVNQSYKVNNGSLLNNTINSTIVYTLKNGNISKRKEEATTTNGYGSTNITTTIFEYDNKKTPFRNVRGLSALHLEEGYAVGANNVTRMEQTINGSKNVTNISYEYNADGYPTKRIARQSYTTRIPPEMIDIYIYNR